MLVAECPDELNVHHVFRGPAAAEGVRRSAALERAESGDRSDDRPSPVLHDDVGADLSRLLELGRSVLHDVFAEDGGDRTSADGGNEADAFGVVNHCRGPLWVMNSV